MHIMSNKKKRELEIYRYFKGMNDAFDSVSKSIDEIIHKLDELDKNTWDKDNIRIIKCGLMGIKNRKISKIIEGNDIRAQIMIMIPNTIEQVESIEEMENKTRK